MCNILIEKSVASFPKSDGTVTPVEWPTCAVMCEIPSQEADYSPRADQSPVTVGTAIDFECSAAGAKVGDTYTNVHTITCRGDGTFPSGWPECEVKCVPPLGGPGDTIYCCTAKILKIISLKYCSLVNDFFA